MMGNLKPFVRLLGSSKAWVMIAACAVALLLAKSDTGVTSKDALEFIKWVVGSYIAGTAIEDAGSKVNTSGVSQ